ncbi:oxidoreductase, partial [Achromatium sp. WMS1]
RLEFADGVVANVVASRVSESRLRRLRVFQPQGYLSLDMVEQTLDIAFPELRPEQQWPNIRRERIQLPTVKPLDAELAAFVEAVRQCRSPVVDGNIGLQALDVALRVRESITSSI